MTQDAESVRARLTASYGAPTQVELPAHTIAVAAGTITVWQTE